MSGRRFDCAAPPVALGALGAGGRQRRGGGRAHHRSRRRAALSRGAGALRPRGHAALRGGRAERLAGRDGTRGARSPPRGARRRLVHHTPALLDHAGLRLPPAHRGLRAVGPPRRLAELPAPPHGGRAPAFTRRAGAPGPGEDGGPDGQQRATPGRSRRPDPGGRDAPGPGGAARPDARHRLRPGRAGRHHLLEPRRRAALRVDEGGGDRHGGPHPDADRLPGPAPRYHGRADANRALGR